MKMVNMKKVLLVFAASLLGGMPVSAEQQVEWIESIVAVVNQQVITQGELDRESEQVIQQLRSQGRTLPDMGLLRNQVLDRMILSRIQLSLAERTGIRIDDLTLDRTIEGIAKQNNLTLHQFREVLAEDGFDFADFREDIRQELTLARLRQREVDNRILVTQQDIDNYLLTQQTQQGGDQEYHLQHIMVALPEGASPEQLNLQQQQAQKLLTQLQEGSDFAEMAITHSAGQNALQGGDLGWRSQGELPTVFAEVVGGLAVGGISDLIRSPGGFHILRLVDKRANSKQRSLITQRLARHILIRPQDEMDIEDARLRLERLRERVVNGEDFAALAKSSSDDTGSAVEGGSLGWVNPGEMVPEFEEQLNKLAKGEVSPVFQSRFGWHIVQLQQQRQHDNTEEQQSLSAQKAIKQRMVEEEHQLWLRRLRDEAFVEVRL